MTGNGTRGLRLPFLIRYRELASARPPAAVPADRRSGEPAASPLEEAAWKSS